MWWIGTGCVCGGAFEAAIICRPPPADARLFVPCPTVHLANSWDWERAGVPEALTDELEERRKEKVGMRGVWMRGVWVGD